MEPGDNSIFNDLFGSQVALEHDQLCITSLEYSGLYENVESRETLTRTYSMEDLHTIDFMQQSPYLVSYPTDDFETSQGMSLYLPKQEILPYGITDPNIFLKGSTSPLSNSSTCPSSTSEDSMNVMVSFGQIVDVLNFSTANGIDAVTVATVAESVTTTNGHNNGSLEQLLHYDCHSNVLLSSDALSLIQTLSPELSGICTQQSVNVNSSCLQDSNSIITFQGETHPLVTLSDKMSSSPLTSVSSLNTVLSTNNQLINGSVSVSGSDITRIHNSVTTSSATSDSTGTTSTITDSVVTDYASDSEEIDEETEKVKELLRMHFKGQNEPRIRETIKTEKPKQKHNGGWTKGKRRKTAIELLKPPKPPLTSFGAFSKDTYCLDKGNISEVSKKLSHQWSRLPIAIKQIYKVKADNDRNRFALELKQYLERKFQGVSDFPISLETLILSTFNCLDDNDCMHCTMCQLSFFNSSCKQAHFCGRPHLMELIKKLEAIIKRHNQNGGLSCPKVTQLPITVTTTTTATTTTNNTATHRNNICQEKRVISKVAVSSQQKNECTAVSSTDNVVDKRHCSDDENVRLLLRRKLLESQQAK